MARSESERVYVLKENFMKMHNEGLGIKEISERCELSSATVYRHLQEIAESNHCTRESLLEKVINPVNRQYWINYDSVQKKSFLELRKDLNVTMELLEEVSKKARAIAEKVRTTEEENEE